MIKKVTPVTRTIKYNKCKKYCDILKKIGQSTKKPFIEKVITSPFSVYIKDVLDYNVIFNHYPEECQNPNNTEHKSQFIIHQKVTLCGNILIHKYHPFYKPCQIPRYQLLDLTAAVSNVAFFNKYMTHVKFFYCPSIRMSFYETLFDYLEWRCFLYVVSTYLRMPISIYLKKDKIHVFVDMPTHLSNINISDLIFTWLDALHTIQTADLETCATLQQCQLHVTKQHFKTHLLLSTTAPEYIETQTLEEQFKDSLYSLLGCSTPPLELERDIANTLLSHSGHNRAQNVFYQEKAEDH